MPAEFEVSACSRRCEATGSVLLSEQHYYSVLLSDGGGVVRRDYAEGAWDGPPAECIGWWRSRLPAKSEPEKTLAPKDVLLGLFVALADEPEEADLRCVLGLLLVRRKHLKQVGARGDSSGYEVLCLEDPTGEKHELAMVTPTTERVGRIQERLTDLVYSGGMGAAPTTPLRRAA
ncbi:MAG: hypothetical protein AAGA92_09610 [Planctomycetota bacterium]